MNERLRELTDKLQGINQLIDWAHSRNASEAKLEELYFHRASIWLALDESRVEA